MPIMRNSEKIPTTRDKIPANVQLYVNFIVQHQPVGFMEIIAVTPGRNYFRSLRDRGLIEDITPPYKRDEPYTGPRESKFILTPLGQSYVTERTAPADLAVLPEPLQTSTDAQAIIEQFLDWIAGACCRASGARESANPYDAGTVRAVAWKHGWDTIDDNLS